MAIGDGFKTRLEFILDQAFENQSGGGDHESRAFVGRRLLDAAQSGVIQRGGIEAHRARSVSAALSMLIRAISEGRSMIGDDRRRCKSRRKQRRGVLCRSSARLFVRVFG